MNKIDDYDDEFDDSEDYDAYWLCVCGEYTDHCHCPNCYAEAPWGCDCGAQNDYDDDYWNEY